MGIDWKDIAGQVGGAGPDGEEAIGTDGGRRALEILLGEENIRAAVDHWADQESGAFAAEMVLRIIRSPVAMQRCYEIYKNEPDCSRASAAIFLLAEMADYRVLPWIREFLIDQDEAIRWNGLIALRQILEGPVNDEGIADAKEFLVQAESDSDQRIRERAAEIRRDLASDPIFRDLGLQVS